MPPVCFLSVGAMLALGLFAAVALAAAAMLTVSRRGGLATVRVIALGLVFIAAMGLSSFVLDFFSGSARGIGVCRSADTDPRDRPRPIDSTEGSAAPLRSAAVPSTPPNAGSAARSALSGTADRWAIGLAGEKKTEVETKAKQVESPRHEGSIESSDSEKDSSEASLAEHDDRQAIDELRRRIFDRVVTAIREIIAEEIPQEQGSSAEEALDSALSGVLDRRSIAEKPLSSAASPPAWFSAPSASDVVVIVGPYVDLAECERHVYEKVRSATAEFIANYLGPAWNDRIALSEEFIRTELIRDRYWETLPASFGPMVQLHLLLSFDGKVKAQIDELQRQWIRQRRLLTLGCGFSAFCAGLVVIYFALRSDIARGGVHRRRTVVVSSVMVGALVVFAVATIRQLLSAQ